MRSSPRLDRERWLWVGLVGRPGKTRGSQFFQCKKVLAIPIPLKISESININYIVKEGGGNENIVRSLSVARTFKSDRGRILQVCGGQEVHAVH